MRSCCLKPLQTPDDEARLKDFNTWCFCGGENTIKSYGKAFSDNDVILRAVTDTVFYRLFFTDRLRYRISCVVCYALDSVPCYRQKTTRDKIRIRDRAKYKSIFSEEHLNFFNTLCLPFELGEYFFCHACVYSDAPLDQQLACDLLWIRNLFLNSRANFGKIVVHGHTPCTPMHHGNRIALDHGSVVNGKLAAVRLEEDGSHDILIVNHIEKWRYG